MIKGISERRRLPRLGKIRLGITRVAANGKSYPVATDHFVCPPEVQRVHGEKPTSLPIVLPLDDAEKIFPQEYKMYGALGLHCAGDGERAKRWGDDGELHELACPCPFLDDGKCKPVATFNFCLPEVPGIGVWQVVTSSERSIMSINSALEAFRNTFGGLAGIPFTLKLEPEDVTRFDDKKRQRVKQTIHVLRLDSPMTMRQIIEWRTRSGAAVAALMPAAETDHADIITTTALPAGDDDSGETEPEPRGPGAAFDRAVPLDEAPWDVSMLYAAAEKVGLNPGSFRNYLIGVYRLDPKDLDVGQIAEARAFLKDGKPGSPSATDVIKRVVEKVSTRVVSQGLKPMPRDQQTLA